MSRLRIRALTYGIGLCLLLGLLSVPAAAQGQSGTPADQTISSSPNGKKTTTKGGAAGSDQSATASHQSNTASETKSAKKSKDGKKFDGTATIAADSRRGDAMAQGSAAANTPVTTETASSKKKSSKKASSGTPALGGTASSPEIAAAKSSGKVWVNLDSGVYHKSGRWYGTTKNGKFMSESEAKQAGYKLSKK